jgi:hypothetical protein
MATHSACTFNTPSKNTKDLDKPDDSSDVTTTTGIEANKIETKWLQKCSISVSLQIPSSSRTKPAHPGAIHIHWLHAIQTALSNEVIIWDNKCEKVGPRNLIQMDNQPNNPSEAIQYLSKDHWR